MTTDLVPYQFKGRQQRIITDEYGVKWWVVSDTCRILGLNNVTAATRHIKRGNCKKMVLPCNHNYPQSMLVVNEGGLITLIAHSDKPVAYEFKEWAFSKAISSIQGSSLSQVNMTSEPYLVSEKLLTMIERLMDRMDNVEKLITAPRTQTQIPQFTAGDETGRARAVRLVSKFGKHNKFERQEYQDYYNDKFDRLGDRHHINICQRAQRQKCKQIDIVEQLGLMPEFISMVENDLARTGK